MIAFTRVERALIDGGFGAGVITGLQQATKADRAAVATARDNQAESRARLGYNRKPVPILTTDASQHKLAKNSLKSYGLMLVSERGLMVPAVADIRAAYNLSGGYNLCVRASKGCAAACLRHAGQSGMPKQQRGQAIRTAHLIAHPYDAGLIIGAELRAGIRAHGEINLRLNVTSDIRWEVIAPDMISTLAGAGVRLYDYTAWSPANRAPSPDYHLTYSAKETAHTSDEYLASILSAGDNVAVPFTTKRGEALPATWLGFPVIDGDLSDERRLDPTGVVVGLRAKGYLWKRDNTAGFIRTV